MSLKKVELMKDKIREYLLAGYSMTATEKELGLTKNDIQRYYERVTGENPSELVNKVKLEKVKKELNLQDDSSQKKIIDGEVIIHVSESDFVELFKRVEKLESRIEKLEKEKTQQQKKPAYEFSIQAHEKYSQQEKEVYSFRISKELKEKLKRTAKSKKISINKLINLILWSYFEK